MTKKPTKELATADEPKPQVLPTGKAFSLTPTNLTEAMKLAEMIAASDLAPKDFKGKSGNCLIAMQMGMEVGLAPMQAIQNIAVINGRPTLWGDAAMGLVLAAPVCEYVREEWEDKTQTWTIRSKRRDDGAEKISTFSMADATKAGLSKKEGPWTNYPKRMIQMRARAFNLRDNFADVLKGLAVREEVEDYVDTTATTVPPVLTPKAKEPETDAPTTATDPAPEQEKPRYMLGGEYNFFLNRMDAMGADWDEVLRYALDKFNVTAIKDLTKSQAKQIIDVWTGEPAGTPAR